MEMTAYPLTGPVLAGRKVGLAFGQALRQVLFALAAARPRHTPLDADAQQASGQAGRLLDEYGNTILRFAYSYLHNMSDAEDILQDTLLQYLRKRPKLESPDHEKAWLLRVAANLSKNRIQYNRIRQADPLEESLAAQGREDLSFVWEAVRQLPVQYRAVVHLFYYEAFTTAEIARILGRKESTVRSDLRRGRLKLKEILKEAYDFD